MHRAENDPEDCSEAGRLIAELRVHQAELEMQNLELRRVQAELEAARERYFDLYDQAPVGYCMLNQEGRIVHYTLTVATLLGRNRTELLDEPLERFIDPCDQDIYDLHRKRVLKSRESLSCELRMHKADGRTFWAHLASSLTKTPRATEVVRVVLSDISHDKVLEERQEHEQTVLELLALGQPPGEVLTRLVLGYESLIPGSRGSILLLDSSGLRLNHECAPSLPPAFCQAIDGVEVGPSVGSCGRAVSTKQKVITADIAADPDWRPFQQLASQHGLKACWSVPILGASDRVLGTLAFYFHSCRTPNSADVKTLERAAHLSSLAVQRSQIMAELEHSQCRSRLLIQAVNIGLWDWDLISGEVYLSKEWKAQLGYAEDELCSRYEEWEKRLHPDDLQSTLKALHDYLDGLRSAYDVEFRLLHRDGDWRWFLAQATLFRDEDGQGRRMMGSHIDITYLKKAEEARRESEELFKNAFQYSNVGMALIWPDGRCIKVNSRLCELLGHSDIELLNQNLRDLTHPEDRDLDRLELDLMLSGKRETYTVTQRYVHKEGRIVWVFQAVAFVRNRQGEIAFFVRQMSDITEQKRAEGERDRLESQLRHASKMQSIGRLAGGVAHDFNNMLGVILGHAEMAVNQTGPAHPVYPHLSEIREAAQRSADLTRQLLAFAARQTVAPRVIGLNDTVARLLRLLHRLIGENIRIVWQPEVGLWPIKMDPTQVDQILTNLCVNSRDAINGFGEICLTTRNCFIAEQDCAIQSDAVPGEFVRLQVGDNGCGMSPEMLTQIFEPFFTTKGVGAGTGLGLATVYGNVRQNGGFIAVSSKPGQGTTFDIYLPRYQGECPSAQPAPPLTVAAVGGHETILLVEDEPSILRLATKMLQSRGYTVLAAGNPHEALRLAEEHGRHLQLLVSDVVMPEMNGPDLAARVLSICPHLKCLFMSGYPVDSMANQGMMETGVLFLKKPFSLDGLAAKVRQAIESAAP